MHWPAASPPAVALINSAELHELRGCLLVARRSFEDWHCSSLRLDQMLFWLEPRAKEEKYANSEKDFDSRIKGFETSLRENCHKNTYKACGSNNKKIASKGNWEQRDCFCARDSLALQCGPPEGCDQAAEQIEV
jgi:hypothetical protein